MYLDPSGFNKDHSRGRVNRKFSVKFFFAVTEKPEDLKGGVNSSELQLS